MTIAHLKVVVAFLIAWLAAELFWHFLIRGFTPHHADNPAVQGIAALT